MKLLFAIALTSLCTHLSILGFCHIPCQTQKGDYEAAKAPERTAWLKYMGANFMLIEVQNSIQREREAARTHPKAPLPEMTDSQKWRLSNAQQHRASRYQDWKNAYDTLSEKSAAYILCKSHAYRNCGCQTKHTKLPSDPCRGFECGCSGQNWGGCSCPFREPNVPGCDGSSGSGSG